ncbi:MAG: DsbE family thiol:disulfide interchange protein [Gammaproteobacteria bacterium]
MRRFLPLLVFLPLAGLMAAALKFNPREVPSPFIGAPAPEFALPSLSPPPRDVSPADMKDQIWILNVWASWCVACRAEHPLLLQLQKETTIVGLNYKDAGEDARAWLARFGDPYFVSAADTSGAAALDWGVYGVPETFVIDRGGIVRHKHIGPLDAEAVANTILPLLRELRGETS